MFKTDQAQDAKKVEKLNNIIFMLASRFTWSLRYPILVTALWKSNPFFFFFLKFKWYLIITVWDRWDLGRNSNLKGNKWNNTCKLFQRRNLHNQHGMLWKWKQIYFGCCNENRNQLFLLPFGVERPISCSWYIRSYWTRSDGGTTSPEGKGKKTVALLFTGTASQFAMHLFVCLLILLRTSFGESFYFG